MSKPALSRMRGLARPHNHNPQSPNLRDSGPSAPGVFSMMPRCGRRRGPWRGGGSAIAAPRRRGARLAQDRLSIDAEKKSKSSPPASTSQARANNPPSRPLRARPTLPMHSRRATGAGMQSGASAPKTRRPTANTRQNNTHRGTGKCEASSWRGKPGLPAPGWGRGAG